MSGVQAKVICAAGPTADDTKIIAVTKAAASETAVWRAFEMLVMIIFPFWLPESG